MLKSLIIKNFALIGFMEVRFSSGLNILTGETGAGKSIIIGALGTVLGSRCSPDIVRQGEDRAVIEAVFRRPPHLDLSPYEEWLDANEPEIVLRRIINANGRSRSFVNDAPISLTLLSSLGDLLVDMHGQHDHQSLLSAAGHIRYLDNFGVSSELLAAVKTSFQQYRQIRDRLTALQNSRAGINERKELLAFQLQEIGDIAPERGEEEELLKSERLLKAGERIHSLAEKLTADLYEGPGSASERLAEAAGELARLGDADELFTEWSGQCQTARIAVEEVVNALQKFVAAHDFDPDQLQDVRERLGRFSMLKKKYGGSVDDILDYYDTIRQELAGITGIDRDILEAERLLVQTESALLENAESLTAARRLQAAVLETQTVAVLHELGLENARFEIQIISRREQLSQSGQDKVEFFISLNSGEPLKPLKDVASGGEISRIMLALKTVLAESDQIPVMIFDEIDNGVSGRIARVVGNKLLENASCRQIICITHLPQIASLGSSHFQVKKETGTGRSETIILRLSAEQRVGEIAKLLGGERVTETAVRSAQELLEQ